jgi:hypothetical protein
MSYRGILGRAAAIAGLLLVLGLASVTALTASPIPAAASSSTAAASSVGAASSFAVADTPSPSLGATSQPNRPMPGDNDSDPNDWSGAPWIIVGVVVIALVLGILTYVLFRGGRLTWRNQRNPVQERRHK